MIATALAVVCCTPAAANELAADSFANGSGEYTLGGLVPQNPTVSNFNTAWSNGLISSSGGTFDVVDTGLYWPDYAVSGGAVSQSSALPESAVRGFSNPNPGTNPIYLSGLMSFDAGFNTATTTTAFTGLLNAEEGDTAVPWVIGLQWGFAGNGSGVDAVIRARTEVVISEEESEFVPLNHTVAANISPGTHLFVARIDRDYNADSTGPDLVTLWLDPAANVSQGDLQPTLSMDTHCWLAASAPERIVDTLILNTTGADSPIMYDEIRMGETWQDVLPNAPLPPRPESSPIVLQEGLFGYEYVDAHVRGGGYATRNFGDYDENTTGTVNGSTPMRGLMAFGLDEIPEGATIDDVTLELTVKRTDIQGDGTGDIGIYLMDPTITTDMVESETTWTLIDADNSWLVGGGDPTTTLLSSVPEFGSEAVGTVQTFASTTELVAAVQAALDGSTTLNMVLMAPDTEAVNQRNFVGFYSDDTGSQENRPKLTISYTAVVPSLPGDANLDGTVDVSDLGILATNYGTVGGAVWADGDFTDDGNVDVSDLGVLATNYGTTSAIAVPEPATIMMFASFVLFVLFVRRRQG